jgi:hypothetical protein
MGSAAAFQGAFLDVMLQRSVDSCQYFICYGKSLLDAKLALRATDNVREKRAEENQEGRRAEENQEGRYE